MISASSDRSINSLEVEYDVAIVVTRVQFPVDAFLFLKSYKRWLPGRVDVLAYNAKGAVVWVLIVLTLSKRSAEALNSVLFV